MLQKSKVKESNEETQSSPATTNNEDICTFVTDNGSKRSIELKQIHGKIV